MNLAIVFWFYKEPEICVNRLEILKRYNPDVKVYGLYGGSKEDEDLFRNSLRPHLDDFYMAPMEDEDWKWIHGDLVLLDWYDERGRHLQWDSVAIVQWDMLVFTSIAEMFSEMQQGQLFLSGYRELTPEIEERWYWTKEGGGERDNYLAFLEYVEEVYGFEEPPLCCLFIFEIFPRVFFERYLEVENLELGMLEYKVPIYAKIFDIEVYEKDLGVCWNGKYWREYPLNALPHELETEYIEKELEKDGGWRIFHPCFREWG